MLSSWHQWSLKQFPGLWAPLKAVVAIEDLRPVLQGICANASKAKITIPEVFRPPQRVDVQAVTATDRGLNGRDAAILLVHKAGLDPAFIARMPAESRYSGTMTHAPLHVQEEILNTGLSGDRPRFLKALVTVCLRSPDFSASIASYAFQFLKKPMDDALTLFEILVQTPGLPLSTYNNAVGALSMTGKLVGTTVQHELFIKAALPYGDRNPSIHANIACVLLVMGRKNEALDQLDLSIKLGHDRILMVKGEVFRPLHTEPRWKALFK